MKLLLTKDAQGNDVAVVRNGCPVYVHEDGKEIEFDAPAAMEKITVLNNESAGHRRTAKQAQEKLAVFEGIEDPAEAKKALDIVKNLDAKKLIDAGEVDKVKKEVGAAYESKLSEKDAEIGKKDAKIYELMVSSQFTSSKFVSDQLIAPPDMVEAMFGKNFKIEDGKLVAYVGEDKVYSRERPGELANFDEAIAVIVDKYPMKDRILKGTGAGGNGSEQKNLGGGGGGAIKRGEMSDEAKSKYISDNGLAAFQALPA